MNQRGTHPPRSLRARLSRRIAAATFAVSLAFTVAGCSSADTPEIPDASPAPLTFDVGTKPDFAVDMIGCLSDQGWPVSEGTDGGFSVEGIPPEQQSVYDTDLENCLEQFGYDEQPPPLTDTQVREVYSHMLWEWKCLNDNGYGPETPLSEQAYVDDYHQYGSLWTPYSQFTASKSEDDLNRLFEACPRAF